MWVKRINSCRYLWSIYGNIYGMMIDVVKTMPTYKNGDDSGMVYGILWHCLPTFVEVWLWSIQVAGKLVILTSHKFAGTVANPTMSLPFRECAKTTCFSLGKWETVYYWAARCCKHLTWTSNETGDAVDKSTSIWSPTARSRWKGLGLFQFR